MSRIKPPEGYRLHRVIRDETGIKFEPPLQVAAFHTMLVCVAGVYWVPVQALSSTFAITDGWIAMRDKRKRKVRP